MDNAKDPERLSWFAAQVMQYFLRILVGVGDVSWSRRSLTRATRISRQSTPDGLCRKLFPSLPRKYDIASMLLHMTRKRCQQ
ncbi:hypothetical protein BDV32DRAFT_133077 [Aspergillus pseudonomiae]|uniref:Uncharacterized protein n=1 Tax=Aspergillus pseudonomiae TaxID=1506151 RepID=A0A5N6HHJ6_9EURO|nr:uncharacterized protein BDV37DRAFT_262179 [Aspergillus pseudonomiae]KAB8254022.1 hypothetical protein BDV32DRAFT_133077 [Aspergillus pseudonomiae]KAE8398867.1 hypothetical protein BDV37DRAFT_262179 [Aspergillus pseudonomiae]